MEFAIASESKQASYALGSASTESKNKVLLSIHRKLVENKQLIIQANLKDMEDAKTLVDAGKLASSLFSRLDIIKKFDSLLQGVLDVVKLDDPIGKTTLATRLDQGLELFRVTCPVGLLLIIFEARPEVVVQISCLAIKSGNAVILKGGKEANNSNQVLFETIRMGILEADCGIKPDIVQLVSDRQQVDQLLKCVGIIDLVIPRGSNQLVRHVQENTLIPVLGHADGICAIYVDESADLEKSIKVIIDSKINYPAACNAAEKVIFHSKMTTTHLEPIVDALLKENVKILCDETIYSKMKNKAVHLATQDEFRKEFLALEIVLISVDSIDEAITHINQYGSHHTDCILTERKENREKFMSMVDSAGVYCNASTRFADGFRYGFGAEIGVSTNKTHARGPVGLEGLTIYKYRLFGDGHVVQEFQDGKRSFVHEEIDLPS